MGSTAKAIPRPANQLLLPLTHTTLGLDEGFSGWDTLQGFFTQNKGPLSGSRLPEWGGGGLSPTAGMKGEGAKESRQEQVQKRQEGLRGAGLSRKNISHQADQKEESWVTDRTTVFSFSSVLSPPTWSLILYSPKNVLQ